MKIKILKKASDLNFELPLEASENMQLTYNPFSYGWFVSNAYVISFIIEKKLFFKKLVFTSDIITIQNTGENKKEFLDEVISLVKTMKVHFIAQSPAFIISSFVPNGAISCPFGTLQIDLQNNEEQLWNNVHTKHRNVIKKAMSENLTVDHGHQYIEDCARLIGETMSRQQKDSVSLNSLKQKAEYLQESLRFYVVKKDNVVQGCAVIAWKAKSKALYLYGGSIPKHITGALNFLQWTILLDMKRENVSLYDLVGSRINPIPGSKYEGIQRFKERMGASLIHGYLWKMPLNRPIYYLYQLFVLLRNLKYEKKIIRDVIDEESKRFKENNSHV